MKKLISSSQRLPGSCQEREHLPHFIDDYAKAQGAKQLEEQEVMVKESESDESSSLYFYPQPRNSTETTVWDFFLKASIQKDKTNRGEARATVLASIKERDM